MNMESIKASSLYPEAYTRFKRLLDTVPEQYWDLNASAEEIKALEGDDTDIKEVLESACMVINAGAALPAEKRTQDWEALYEKAKTLRHNIEVMFPKIYKQVENYYDGKKQSESSLV